MTYNVFGGTLNLAQSINQPHTSTIHGCRGGERLLHYNENYQTVIVVMIPAGSGGLSGQTGTVLKPHAQLYSILLDRSYRV